MEREVGLKRSYRLDMSAMTRAIVNAMVGKALRAKKTHMIGRGRFTLYTQHKKVPAALREACSPDFTKFEDWSRQRKRRFFMEVEKETSAKRRQQDRRDRVAARRAARRRDAVAA